MATLGERVRDAREALGWTQVELGERIGWSNKDLSLVEQGGRNISTARLRALAVALGVTSDWLLGLPGAPRTRRAAKRARKP